MTSDLKFNGAVVKIFKLSSKISNFFRKFFTALTILHDIMKYFLAKIFNKLNFKLSLDFLSLEL